MTLRTRLLIAFAAVVFIPLALLAFGLRQNMSVRLSDEYQGRVTSAVKVIGDDLGRESEGIERRLASLKAAIQNDNAFRAAVAGEPAESAYVIDYAGTAMRLTGLSMLQIQDGDGRIISSGHFRNEHGRAEAGLGAALARAKGGRAFAAARAPDGDFLALARAESLRIADRTFTLVGGVVVDGAFLRRLAGNAAIVVSLSFPGGRLSADPAPGSDDGSDAAAEPDAFVEELAYPLIRSTTEAPVDVLQATLRVAHSRTALTELLRDANRWFLATAAGTGATALLLAVWVSSRISRPLAALAEKTSVLDLDRLDLEFESGSGEVGTLSMVLGDLASRLRTSTARVREAERRATVGDLARQINHDIKNGLIPLRNVMRHLAQVGRDDPASLGAVFAERRQTVDSSIAYLETLATNYERLSTPADRRECDLNALIADVIRAAQGHEHVDFRTELAEGLPRVVGDPVAFRRILENLVANAVDSLESRAGGVTVSAESLLRDAEPPAVRVTVADTGRGMSKEESGRIFADFYTTKPDGTGLGLSIVRRLVMDLHGTLRVESEPGVGTRMIVELPSVGAGRRRA